MGHFSTEAATKVCRRLSAAEDLPLPFSFTRHRETQPSHDEVELYLIELLQRDPSVFLERYGKELQVEELELFAPLSGDYEVSFHLSQLRSMTSAKRALCVKNRRLAYMMKLMDDGEYFEDEQMRERDPLLFQRYMGKDANPYGSKPKNLSESLVRNIEEQNIQQRLAEAKAQELPQDNDPDDDVPETAALPEGQGDPVDYARFMRSEFETIMQERFLSGMDTKYVDYATIDNDITLDDDLLEIEERDHEDRYFDTM